MEKKTRVYKSNRLKEYNQFYNLLITYIRDTMEYKCVKIVDVACAIGMKPIIFTQKLRNKQGYKFNLLELKRICDELNMTVDYLIRESLKMKSTFQ